MEPLADNDKPSSLEVYALTHGSDNIKDLVVCSAGCGFVKEGGTRYKACKRHGHGFTQMRDHIEKQLGRWLPGLQPHIDGAEGARCGWCGAYLPRGEGVTCRNCAAKLRSLPA